MYIHPFVCEIIATILVELGILIAYTIHANTKNK